MNYKFVKRNGERVNLIEYIKTQITRHPDTKVYIGTDSQDRSIFSHYVTVVAFRYGNKGAHIVWKHNKFSRVNDHWSRLWREIEMTIEVANYIRDVLPFLNIKAVEVDFNGEKNTLSNKLVKAARGWCEGLGYNVLVKPDEQIACQAADWILK